MQVGRRSEEGLFGPESVSWQVNREMTVLLGGARALLMQAAHPLVLAGARQTGFYERNPWKRLERTLRLQYTITFGTVEQALDAARRINEAHALVHGIDDVTGLPYDAKDPELLLWVHACLVDSSLLFEALTVGKLDDEGRERFHGEQMTAAELIGLARDRVPPTVPALRAYIHETIAGPILRTDGDAARIASLMRRPPPDVPRRAVLRPVSWFAFATLPPPLREGYGMRWTPLHELALRSGMRALRTARPFLPEPLREIMPARIAKRRVADWR